MAMFCSCVFVLLFCIFAVGRTQRPYAPDVCSLPMDVGPCAAAFQRYYFDKNTGLCTLFIWGGCQPNGNNFQTKEACVQRCGCKAPAKTGPCRANIPRYYYNVQRDLCLKFVYGGCQANENNFRTGWQCRNACGWRRYDNDD